MCCSRLLLSERSSCGQSLPALERCFQFSGASNLSLYCSARHTLRLAHFLEPSCTFFVLLISARLLLAGNGFQTILKILKGQRWDWQGRHSELPTWMERCWHRPESFRQKLCFRWALHHTRTIEEEARWSLELFLQIGVFHNSRFCCLLMVFTSLLS